MINGICEMEYENLIQKSSNLELNDSITNYDGWGAQQNPHTFEVFYNFLKKVKPKQILEIGTSLGGFTFFLKKSCQRLGIDCSILTYDIYGRHGYDDLVSNGIDVRIENVFNSDYSIVEKEVIDYINKEGTSLVLCDGGDKIKEFNLLSNYLKIGDIIMAHDYSYDKKTFDTEINKKYWNWFEISEKDIKESCLRNNLYDLDVEKFKKCVWVCKIKK